ncbi:MAG: helix-turn-helix domain-containing protein [Candidatus Lokiarchaeota archaeon]|nr:helix-turn-helix domain-containing protein [Candidatus Lokiarchaeota archaeon]
MTSDTDGIKKQLTQKVEVMKLLNTVTRLRIILILLVYGKQSLAELEEKIGRTKATITHHIKKFEELGIIKTTRKNARGSIDAKVYQLIPEFLDLIQLSPEELNLIEGDDQKDILQFLLLRDKWMFEMIRNIFQLINLFYKDLEFDFVNLNVKDFEQVKKQYFENLVQYDILFLNKEHKDEYNELLKSLKSKLSERREKENDDITNDAPYLIFNSIIPLEDILKYDPETRKFIRFFRVFDKE